MCWVINKAGLGNLPNTTLELQIWLKEMWHKSWVSFYYYYYLLSPVWLENFELLSVHLLGKSFKFSSSLLLQAQEKSQAALRSKPCFTNPPASTFPQPSHSPATASGASLIPLTSSEETQQISEHAQCMQMKLEDIFLLPLNILIIFSVIYSVGIWYPQS